MKIKFTVQHNNYETVLPVVHQLEKKVSDFITARYEEICAERNLKHPHDWSYCAHHTNFSDYSYAYECAKKNGIDVEIPLHSIVLKNVCVIQSIRFEYSTEFVIVDSIPRPRTVEVTIDYEVVK